MTFVALASAYVFLSGSDQWRPVNVPKVFLVSTSVIVVSSLTMERSRRLVTVDAQRYGHWLLLTLVLGIAFVVTQVIGWSHLAAQGVYLSSNPHSSFFYLFTGAHGLHLAGGMVALTYLVVRSRFLLLGVESEKRVAATDAVSIYWHFMDGLWIYLFVLLFFWR